MCCRYWADQSPELRKIVAEMNRSPLLKRWREKEPSGIVTYGEVRPTNIVPVIAPDKTGSPAVYPMKWGFPGKSLLMNARAETAAVKPMFRTSWARNRCIVPASWYFEWEHPKKNERDPLPESLPEELSFNNPSSTIRTDGSSNRSPASKQKYRIMPKDSAMTWLCGLYRIEEGLPVFVILTREPGEEIRFIHDRMPLILPESRIREWIRPETRPEDLLSSALTEMVFEKAL